MARDNKPTVYKGIRDQPLISTDSLRRNTKFLVKATKA
jgi:hypothetical protein